MGEAILDRVVVYPVFRVKRLEDFAAFEKQAKLKVVKLSETGCKEKRPFKIEARLLLDGFILEWVVFRTDVEKILLERGENDIPTSARVTGMMKSLYSGFLENGYIEGDFVGTDEYVIPPEEV